MASIPRQFPGMCCIHTQSNDILCFNSLVVEGGGGLMAIVYMCNYWWDFHVWFLEHLSPLTMLRSEPFCDIGVMCCFTDFEIHLLFYASKKKIIFVCWLLFSCYYSLGDGSKVWLCETTAYTCFTSSTYINWCRLF